MSKDLRRGIVANIFSNPGYIRRKFFNAPAYKGPQHFKMTAIFEYVPAKSKFRRRGSTPLAYLPFPLDLRAALKRSIELLNY